jgi:bifunctional non-homologous end joining protein LigD
MGKKRSPSAAKQPASRTAKPTTKRRAKRAPTARSPGATEPPSLRFTHVDKVWFPAAGITKGDVLQYYLGVADKLIPHLRDRPITLERMPDGVGEGKPRFWQKNTPDYYPSWIRRFELPNDEGKPVQYALVNDVHTLAYLVNQGAITFHPFLSRVQHLDQPDYVLFDLDPGGAKLADVVSIAKTIREVLRDQDVEPFVKTSGKSGLHLWAPRRDQDADHDAARAWAMGVAQQVVKELPKLATVERRKAERDGRVYVDVIQNGLARHAVPPYVVRPTSLATVSIPLDWKELTPKLDPKKFTIKTVGKRFDGKPDPLLPLVRD